MCPSNSPLLGPAPPLPPACGGCSQSVLCLILLCIIFLKPKGLDRIRGVEAAGDNVLVTVRWGS